MDIIVSAGIALLIAGAFLKIKDKVGSWVHEIPFNRAYRVIVRGEVDHQVLGDAAGVDADAELLRHVGEQIAQSLGIGEQTVLWYRKRLYAKLDVHSAAAFATEMMKRGYLK